jgi:hypothetical protein
MLCDVCDVRVCVGGGSLGPVGATQHVLTRKCVDRASTTRGCQGLSSKQWELCRRPVGALCVFAM